jgi:hypothetical protein
MVINRFKNRSGSRYKSAVNFYLLFLLMYRENDNKFDKEDPIWFD